MSKIVGLLLHNALLKAGHIEWHTVHTGFDISEDEILVRFDSGTKLDGKHIDFRIPAQLFDPVAYAQEKWPKRFVDKSIEETNV
jgi:hypothetical protein